MEIEFKKATLEDVDILFKWANDIEVRDNSFNSNMIEYSDHVKWVTEKLSSEKTIILIAMANKRKIGQIRLEVNEDIAVINYSIDKHERGKGFGMKLIECIDNNIKKYSKNVNVLQGEVKKNNIASIKIFEKNNFEPIIEEDKVVFLKEV